MPLGRPDLATPRDLSLRSLQQVVDNVRARLKAIDAEILSLSSTGTSAASASTSTLNGLSATLRTLTARVVALENALGVMDIVTMAAAGPIAQYAPVVPVSATDCDQADPEDPTRRFGVLGIALVAASAGDTVQIQRRGSLTIPDAVFDPGKAVYAIASGITQSPGYLSTAIAIGVATGTSTLWVAPTAPVLLQPGLYAEPNEEAMAVSLSLLRSELELVDALTALPPGFVVRTPTGLESRVLVAGSGSGLVITDGDGQAGDPQFAVE